MLAEDCPKQGSDKSLVGLLQDSSCMLKEEGCDSKLITSLFL